MSKTHWKKLTNPDFLGAWDVPEGGELVVTIERVTQEKVTGSNGKADDCMVAKMKGNKPLILNKTNAKQIEKLAGSPFIEDWGGLTIALFVSKVSAFGDIVDAIRVRPRLPQTKQVKSQPLEPERFEKMKTQIETGNLSLKEAQQILKKDNRTLTVEQEKALGIP